ncbi:helix-turn-helix domain-containing protein [Xanthomonas campestris]|uniref:helix-turn-helix domain-containing protein n=1 Tax=Xanthomonas campestris TaxID=339 RepID=UPI000E3257CF|nr:helix-turn-helix domain-containing protein [Xanthomonas campestris]RFF50174.1 helix-turn-helix domain-containing protein [Xanthomonas campestris]
MSEEGSKRRPLVLRWRSAVFNSSECASAKLTLLALAENANQDGTECYPSIDRLARQSSQSEKTCREALKAADGRWFVRTPIKLGGREWRGYNYRLTVPDGAVTITGPCREVAVTVTAANGARSGNSGAEVRQLTPKGAVTVTDDLGKAPRKSTKGEERAADAASSRLRRITYEQWEAEKPEGALLIPGDDPIFDYAEQIELPGDLLTLAWKVFADEARSGSKRSLDWPAEFAKAVRGNWYKLWYIDNADGSYQLTTQGKQAERLYRIGIAA